MAKKPPVDKAELAASLAALTAGVSAFHMDDAPANLALASPATEVPAKTAAPANESEQKGEKLPPVGEGQSPAPASEAAAAEPAPQAPAGSVEPAAAETKPEPTSGPAVEPKPTPVPAAPAPAPVAVEPVVVEAVAPPAASPPAEQPASVAPVEAIAAPAAPDAEAGPEAQAGPVASDLLNEVDLATLFTPSSTRKGTMLRITADNQQFFTNLGFILGDGASAPDIIHNILTRWRAKYEKDLQKQMRKQLQKKI